jgi:hypothetical protein
MDYDVKENLSNQSQWMRVVYMVLFSVALYLVLCLMGLVVLAQIVFSLLTGKPNDNLKQFGADISLYIHQIVKFLTYNQDTKPYPFNPLRDDASTSVTIDGE